MKLLVLSVVVALAEALVVSPLQARAPMRTSTIQAQFGFGKKDQSEPESKPASQPFSTGEGGGLFGAFSKNKGPGRKSDGGMTTAGFAAARNAAKGTPAKGKAKTTKKSVQPEKWIQGRSGPQINPAWTRWSQSQ